MNKSCHGCESIFSQSWHDSFTLVTRSTHGGESICVKRIFLYIVRIFAHTLQALVHTLTAGLLAKDSVENLVGGASVVGDVFAARSTRLVDEVGMGKEVVHKMHKIL